MGGAIISDIMEELELLGSALGSLLGERKKLILGSELCVELVA